MATIIDPQTGLPVEINGPIPAGSLGLYQNIAPQMVNRVGKGDMIVAPPAGTEPIPAIKQYPPGVLGPVPAYPGDVRDYNQVGALTPAREQGALMPEPSTNLGVLSFANEPKDNSGLFSFMNNPGATDSLVAFGSAMLRAPDFNTGLADAADAVNKVAQQYRPISDVEINNLNQRAMVAAMARRIAYPPDPPAPQESPQVAVEWSRPLYDANDTLFYPATDLNGNPGFYNSTTGEIVPTVQGGLRAEDSRTKYTSKSAVKSVDDARDASVEAFKRVGQANTLLSIYDSAGGGPSGWDKVSREASRFFETDVLGVNPADTQRIENILADMELSQAQTQRGLGQLTEAERAIIRRSIPDINQSRDAFVSVVFAMKRQSERAKLIYRNWSRSKELQSQYPNVEDYYLDWMEGQEAAAFDNETQTKLGELLAKQPESDSSNPELEDALNKY